MSRLTTSHNLLNQHLTITPPGYHEPRLPDWMMSLPGIPRVVGRLGVTEFRRRLFHMFPALLPLPLAVIPHPHPWGSFLNGVLFTIVAIVGIFSIVLAPHIKRPGEHNWRSAVLGYMVPVVAGLVLIPARAEIGLMTLQILALGDGSATLGGLMFRGRKLPWNRRKTISGLLCFTIAGTLGGTFSYWTESNPGIAVGTAFLICLTSALCAGIVESIPSRSNDNFRVGMTALLVGIGMTALLA